MPPYAYESSKKKDFEHCLYKASKTKADVDILLNTLGMREDRVDEVIEERLEIVKQVISRLNERGVFPIIGYSYYEYANSLKENDKINWPIQTPLRQSKVYYFP